MVKGMKYVMEDPSRFYNSIRLGRIGQHLPRFLLYNKMNAWGIGRELPQLAKETFNDLWKNGKVQNHESSSNDKNNK